MSGVEGERDIEWMKAGMDMTKQCGNLSESRRASAGLNDRRLVDEGKREHG